MEQNLLSSPKFIKKWTPRFSTNPDTWIVFSGTWAITDSKTLLCQGKTSLRTGENISLTGIKNWSNYSLDITFRILSESIRPPEGGVIFYYHYKNFRNYYSLHFCHSKNKIELIKRVRGSWSTIAKEDFEFTIEKEYRISAGITENVHFCMVNGKNCYKIQDTDVSNGRIGIGTKFCSAEFTKVKVHISLN